MAIPLLIPLAPVVGSGGAAAAVTFTVGSSLALAKTVFGFRRETPNLPPVTGTEGLPSLQEMVADWIAGAKIPVGSPLPPPFNPGGLGLALAAASGVFGFLKNALGQLWGSKAGPSRGQSQTGQTGFAGFQGQGFFNELLIIDEDDCSFGPGPSPDGRARFTAATGQPGKGVCVMATRNMASLYSVGQVYTPNIGGLTNVVSNTRAQIPGGPYCGNPTGEKVRVELSGAVPGGSWTKPPNYRETVPTPLTAPAARATPRIQPITPAPEPVPVPQAEPLQQPAPSETPALLPLLKLNPYTGFGFRNWKNKDGTTTQQWVFPAGLSPEPAATPGTLPGADVQPMGPVALPKFPTVFPSSPNSEPTTQTQPDGTLTPTQAPPAVATAPDAITPYPGAPPLVGNGPAPNLEAMAKELGRIESKLEIMLKGPTGPGGNFPDWLDLISGPLGAFIRSLFDGRPGQTWQLFGPCEIDENGDAIDPPEPREILIPTTSSDLDAVLARFDGMVQLIQEHKNLRQPTCTRKAPMGEFVTVNFEQI